MSLNSHEWSPRNILKAHYLLSFMFLLSFDLYTMIVLSFYLPSPECIPGSHGFYSRCDVFVQHVSPCHCSICHFSCSAVLLHSLCLPYSSALAATLMTYCHVLSLAHFGYTFGYCQILCGSAFLRDRLACVIGTVKNPFLGDIKEA